MSNEEIKKEFEVEDKKPTWEILKNNRRIKNRKKY